FYVGDSVTSIGYGYFSMNLNALYNPVSKGFSNWSAFFSEKPNMYLQIEGFNYLGSGIILFLPVCILLFFIKYKKECFKTALNFAKNYFGIIFSTTALFIFAIGDWVRFGGLELFRIPFPEFLVNGLFGIFRANGRFGNMLVYMIIIFIVYMVLTTDLRKLSPAFLTVLVAVQIFDLNNVLISKYNYFHGTDKNIQGQAAPQVLYTSFWDDAAEKFDYLYMISDCVPNANFELTSKFAKAGKAVNTRFDIKIDEEKFREMEKDVLGKIVDDKLNDNSLILLNFIPDKYKEPIKNGEFNVFYVEDIVVICNSLYTDSDLKYYINEGNFEILEYPYIVQAELDFETQYGV
ncbi:MAG: hypothetical protein IJD80_02375, partial [Oscillospiraceae bacterium]|nr:hypothetical protein [Oscillospiraceae bacterium]